MIASAARTTRRGARPDAIDPGALMAALRANIGMNLAALHSAEESDRPCTPPVLVDWLAHLEERFPGSETAQRRALRAGLILGLDDPAMRGKQSVVDQLIVQVKQAAAFGDLAVAESAAAALDKVATATYFPQMVTLLSEPLPDSARFWLARYLRKVKSAQARDVAVSYLGTPFVVAALVALAGMRAPGVRALVTPLIDHPNADVRKYARRALPRLPFGAASDLAL